MFIRRQKGLKGFLKKNWVLGIVWVFASFFEVNGVITVCMGFLGFVECFRGLLPEAHARIVNVIETLARIL